MTLLLYEEQKVKKIKMKLISLQFLLALSLCERYQAFVYTSPKPVRKKASQQSYRNDDSNNCRLNALTERQQQFWEDVEDGLDDIHCGGHVGDSGKESIITKLCVLQHGIEYFLKLAYGSDR